MKVVLASSNPGKIKEFQEIFSKINFIIMSQNNFNVPNADETGLTFIENAIIKARNACKYTNLPALADDSGLEVDILNGAPGIYTARFAGENASAEDHNNKLLAELKDVPKEKRTARFCCALVFMRHHLDPTPIISQAFWHGLILEKPDGKNGFGYDPIFYVPEKNLSAAKLNPEEKHQISHRGKALKKLLRQLKETQTFTTL